MTDAPTRKISGLAPRGDGPALGRLVKANRDAAPTPAPTPAEPAATAPQAGLRDTPQVEATPTPTPPATAATPRAAAKGRRSTPPATDSKATITIYVPNDVRARSRAAFKATQHLEGDASYSDMITKAIAAEVARREAAHNSGMRFMGGDQALPSGRPLTD